MANLRVQDKRRVLLLGTPSYALSEYEDICKRYFVQSISRDGFKNHKDVTEAIAREVSQATAAGEQPYVGFIWFFDTSRLGPFDESMLHPLTDSGCRFFSGGGAGYDDIETQWMASQGAYYCNTPTAVTISTANAALMLIFAATRAITHGDTSTKAGKWRGDQAVPEEFLPIVPDVEGLKLGIIGLGAIGKALSVRAQACGMEVMYYARNRVPDSESTSATYVSMDELLVSSDVISVNCPLTPETRHLLGPVEFAKMKTGVFIVNTARGPIIDEEALVAALRSGKVLRAGLDVFEREPIVHPGLLDPALSRRVTLQPHAAARTHQSFMKAEGQIFKSLKEFMRGERPEYAVNHPKI
ncbi:D-isomer specific 2-hydroxyacid dehydrogenase [Roridomyces roridus]|uniref:D-isomer specific 2-hydroxyacid dehydrogenase n=1 Tax=Roridomyces roridus TaxID=1738132 RepID=A0AAD7G0I6_9AGAR|nr:D-isomer specific 2-hydroxyacid dehydrogenase [Roridomyces roridus]